MQVMIIAEKITMKKMSTGRSRSRRFPVAVLLVVFTDAVLDVGDSAAIEELTRQL
jgi:hypothetical protein